MKTRVRNQIVRRQRRVARRLLQREVGDSGPVLKATTANFEMSHRASATSAGGVRLAHDLAQITRLPEEIDQRRPTQAPPSVPRVRPRPLDGLQPAGRRRVHRRSRATPQRRGIPRHARRRPNPGPDDGRRLLPSVRDEGCHRRFAGRDQREPAACVAAPAGVLLRAGHRRRRRHDRRDHWRVQRRHGHVLQGAVGLPTPRRLAGKHPGGPVPGSTTGQPTVARRRYGTTRSIGDASSPRRLRQDPDAR